MGRARVYSATGHSVDGYRACLSAMMRNMWLDHNDHSEALMAANTGTDEEVAEVYAALRSKALEAAAAAAPA